MNFLENIKQTYFSNLDLTKKPFKFSYENEFGLIFYSDQDRLTFQFWLDYSEYSSKELSENILEDIRQNYIQASLNENLDLNFQTFRDFMNLEESPELQDGSLFPTNHTPLYNRYNSFYGSISSIRVNKYV